MDRSLYLIGAVLVGLYVILTIFFLVRIEMCRNVIQDFFNQEGVDEKVKGRWYGGEFLFQPFLSIDTEGRDKDILDEIKAHNKFVKWLWVNSMTLIVGLYLLGHSN